MGRMIFGMLTSLDGYIAGPDGGPQLPIPNGELHLYFNEMMRQASLNLYGRRMYEVMRAWETYDRDPAVSDIEREFARLWQETPKIVFSTTLREVGPNARLVSRDAEAAAREIKAGTDGDILVSGPELAASFARHGLIDEYQLFMHPVVLGGGKPFFAGGLSLNVEPLGTERLPQDVILLRYAPAG
jgi:dihydrofolate reductase